jgi:uncharacterized protein (TIGR03435 family)
MYPRLLIALLATAATLTGCGPRPAAPDAAAVEADLGLTRQLPPDYAAGCIEILREMHVNPCPPLIPAGPMWVRVSDGSPSEPRASAILDMMFAKVLTSINGRKIDAHDGHWTIEVGSDQRSQRSLSEWIGSGTPPQCQIVELKGQRVEFCRAPLYPDGGYYGDHIVSLWQRGDVAYVVSLHGHDNEPRLRLMMAALIERETTPRVAPRFESATIRPCAEGDSVFVLPGRVVLNCRTVASLVETAYLKYESGLTNAPWAVGERGTVVTGGPSWVHSDKYTVDVSTDSTLRTSVVLGPMLQTLLEERFGVKAHFEHRDGPVYDLTMLPQRLGPNGEWPSLLPAFKNERCVPRHSAREDAYARLQRGERYCNELVTADAGSKRISLDVEGATIVEFANQYLGALPFLDRHIRNRTGFGASSRFNFTLRFAPRRDSLFSALEELGLKLEPATGRARILVIDDAKRPPSSGPPSGGPF